MMDYKIYDEEMKAAIYGLEGLGYKCVDTRVDSEGIPWYLFESEESAVVVAISDGWYRAWDKTHALPVSYHFTLVDDFWKQTGWTGQVSKTQVPDAEMLLASILAECPHYGHCGLPAPQA